MATADILRRAADLTENGTADSARDAILLASFGPITADQAMKTLAAHLNYATDRDPTSDLRRWSQMRTPAQIAAQMRSAADAAERGAL